MNEEENNILIAKFDGFEFVNDAPDDYPKGYYCHPEIGCMQAELFQYHNDWNWLMEIVEKIEKLGYLVVIQSNLCNIQEIGKFENNFEPKGISEIYGEDKLEATYL